LTKLGRIGKYQLLKRLATGGMAEIYLARQTGLEGFEKLVVLKRILPNLATQERFVDMFLDEARIAARFNHSNIVQIYDLGQQDNAFYIAMEYINGQDIKSIVRRCAKRKKRIPIEHVVKIFSGILGGLHYAHSQKGLDGTVSGVVHRDVSPHNIIVSYEGDVKLVDFGIAKARSEISTTMPGRVKGKHAYMSPEQIQGADLDGRSDVFSAGIVMYELLAWTRLFKRKTDLDTLKAALGADIVPLRTRNPEIDVELEGIINKALTRDLDKRYQSAQEMQSHLEDYLLVKGLRSNQIFISQFMADLFSDELAAMSKALGTANASDLENAVRAAEKEGNQDLVVFLDMFFGDGSGSGPEASDPGSLSGPIGPEFTPSTEYTPANLKLEASPHISEIPARVRGEYLPRRAPPPKMPDGAGVPSIAPQTDSMAPQPIPELVDPSADIIDPGYDDDDRYSDVLAPMGKKKGKGLWIFLFLVILGLAGGLLYSKRDELTVSKVPATGVLFVTSVPGGADVFLDEQRLPGRTPTDIGNIEPGKEYILKVTLPDLPEWEKKITLTDTTKPLEIKAVLSKSEALQARLKGKPIVAGAEGQGFGKIKIESVPPGAMIFLDGLETGKKTPFTLRKVPASLDHVVLLEWEGKPPVFDRLHLKADEEFSVSLAAADGQDGLPDRAKLRFETEPENAKLTINGFSTEKYITPMAAKLLVGGTSEVELTAKGFRDWQGRVRPVPGVDLTIYTVMKKK